MVNRTVEDIGEEGIIEDIKRRFTSSIPLGIGDDTALIESVERHYIVLTIDSFREDIHFKWDYFEPEDVGWKAVAVSLSDVAAMGGDPEYLLLSLGIPGGTNYRIIQSILTGIGEINKIHNMALIGGNVSRSSNGFTIDSVVIGRVERGKEIRREGAQCGDLIYVTGRPGSSAIGLTLLRQGISTNNIGQEFIRCHRRPYPRIREGKILSTYGIATSMIDISDGLIKDLHHICITNRVSASIDTNAIPCPPVSTELAYLLPSEPIGYALYGGEDYELLFTARNADREKLENLCQQEGLIATCIGEIIPGEEGKIIDKASGKVLPVKGYNHFSYS